MPPTKDHVDVSREDRGLTIDLSVHLHPRIVSLHLHQTYFVHASSEGSGSLMRQVPNSLANSRALAPVIAFGSAIEFER